MEQEGGFQGTCSKVAISYNYGHPSSSTGAVSPALLWHLFQWFDDEEEISGYASSATISSVRTWLVSANMVDNNNNDDLRRRMEAQEQTFRAQHEALENIQQMLAQLLNNRNDDSTGSNHDEEENRNNEPHKTKKSKKSSSIDAKVIKGIQAQITSLAQMDELKKVGITHPYPLKWDSVPSPLKFKPPMLHSMMVRALRIITSVTSSFKPVT